MVLVPILLVAASTAASASGSIPHATALRASSPPRIDGRLDDAIWARAEVLDGFVQRFPDEGKPATERTEVRIVYDDRALYIGYRCWDTHAREIHPRLGRRDNFPESDWVAFSLDPSHDHRAAYFFLVNSAGVQMDGVTPEGQNDNMNWDGVWEAQTSIDAEGWSAEIRIPFSTLRFPRKDIQTWAFHVRRYISRLKEQDDWNLVRMNDSSFVGRFADLDGIEGVRPGLSLQLSPYVSATLRPSFSQDSLAQRDDSSAQAGFDVKYALTGTLTLDATVNPDFGQVEVDPEVLNLSAFEVFFPEKRPFFLEGADIFDSAGPLIYTRRIGAAPAAPDPLHGGDVVQVDRTARIFGATRLTGNLRPGTAVGLLSAYVDSTEAVERVGAGPLSPTYRLQATAPSFFNAARVRQVVSGRSSVGATVTSVVRGDGQPSANVAAADFDVRGKGDYTATGMAGWSFTKACDPTLVSTFSARGTCDAAGGSFNAGKTGGELQAWEELTYYGADLDINDLGFLQHLIGNQYVSERSSVGWIRPRPLGPFKQIVNVLSYQRAWDPNAGDRSTSLPAVENRVSLDGMLRLRANWDVGWYLAHSFDRFDDAETRQNELVRLYHRPGTSTVFLRLRSNDSKPFWAQLRNYLDYEGGTFTVNPGLDASLLVGGRLQLGTSVNWTQWLGRPRWVDTAGDGLPLFGELDLEQMDVTLRATASFTRNLTIQLFTQLLRAAQRYPHLSVLRNPSLRDPCDSSASCNDAVMPGTYDADLTSLIANAVLRWEFHPGSTLFMVYTHNHQISGNGNRFELGHALGTLADTPADNVLALKLTYLWSL